MDGFFALHTIFAAVVKTLAMETQSAVLILQDGTIYHGQAAGYRGTTVGEVCFNTGMTGYQEIFTDPSYYGQLLTMTNVHIGNYGAKDADQESQKVQIAGLICKNFTEPFSRPLADSSIQKYCEDNKLIAISGIDTRSLVKHIREKGAMNAIICSEDRSIEDLKKELAAAPSMEGLELATKVTTGEPYDFGDANAEFKVAVLDFGTKRNILRSMAQRGIAGRVFPATATMTQLNEYNADGYFLSNGPGDPSAMDYAIQTVREILKLEKPIFGICLGHQLLSLALGISTYKMHNGHRGANHPVKNVISGKCEITSQNHGFNVAMEDVKAKSDILEITHTNLNDDTVEGIQLIKQPGFSVQFHPEASPGPHDSRYLFDQFYTLLKENKA